MAANDILFRDLPFRPGYNQVFYIERGYDQRVNDFIRCYYDDLKLLFARRGFDFYYLPFLLKEEDVEARVRYYAPYLSAKLLCGKEVQSSALARYISDDAVRRGLGPSFVFGAEQEGWGGTTWLLQLPLADIDFAQPEALERLVEQMAAELEGCRGVMLRGRGHGQPSACGPVKMNATLRMSREESSARLSAPPEAMGCRLPEETRQVRPEPAARSGKGRLLGRLLGRFGREEDASTDESAGSAVIEKTEEQRAEEQSLFETEKVLRELRIAVQRLRLEGVSLMAIHEFIDKQEPLSRMVITPDYRIWLPDYNDMEIEMAALPKAVYFLFLRYPEGIVCKHMQDYYKELLNIYRQLRPHTDESRLNLTITKVTNPLGNALNENIARIRKAFVEKFDEHLANNYIITGERGLRYSIPLDRELITWEEEE